MEAYPLQWPLGYERTLPGSRKDSLFKQSMDKAQQNLRAQLKMMKATDLVVSTNIPVRKDGMMYADYMARRIDDPGVAIYFKIDGVSVSMCCDYYNRVWENIHALALAIEGLRTIQRHHVSEFIKRAFTGFTALPPAADTPENPIRIWDILGLPGKPDSISQVKNAYYEQAKVKHPDAGGSVSEWNELVNAYESATNFFK